MNMTRSWNFLLCFSLFWIVVLLSEAVANGNNGSSKYSKPSVIDRVIALLRTSSKWKQILDVDRPDSRNQRPATENIQYKCQVLIALYAYWRMNFRTTNGKNIVGTRLKLLLRECETPNIRFSDFVNQSTIFPGTKWCGQSNMAVGYEDLGFFNETDRCCREHDFCNDIIQPGKSKYNLVNPYSTTRLNCKCDETLRKCFTKVNSVISNTMGYVFFSMLQTQCFKFEHPAIGCEVWKPGSVRLYCVKYELDKSKSRKWQWFDQEPYF